MVSSSGAAASPFRFDFDEPEYATAEGRSVTEVAKSSRGGGKEGSRLTRLAAATEAAAASGADGEATALLAVVPGHGQCSMRT
jgi:hypothetical protein